MTALHDALKARGYVIYAGQGDLAARVFRVANMGHLTMEQFQGFLGGFDRGVEQPRRAPGTALPGGVGHPSPGSLLAALLHLALRTTGEFVPLPGFHLLDQLLIRRARNDAVELRTIVIDQADALDQHIIDQPAPIDFVQSVFDGYLLIASRHHNRLDRRSRPVHLLADILDVAFFLGCGLEAIQIRALDEVPEELDEFLLFLRRALAPVHRQRPPGDFLPVKDLIGEFVQALLAFGLPVGRLELRVVQDFQDLIGGLPDRGLWVRRPRLAR